MPALRRRTLCTFALSDGLALIAKLQIEEIEDRSTLRHRNCVVPPDAFLTHQTNLAQPVCVSICHSVCGLSRCWSYRVMPYRQDSSSLDHVPKTRP